MMTIDLMVAVATGQNTTNLVPFVQLGAKKMLLLETDAAQKRGWGNGLVEVLERRGCNISRVAIGPGNNFEEILNIVEKKVSEHKNPILWNAGGGQKLQTLALYECFRARAKKGKADVLCYAEPQLRKTTRITVDGDGFKTEIVRTDARLALEEIVTTFNYKLVAEKKRKLLWSRQKGLVEDNLLADDALAWIYDDVRRQKMFEYTLLAYQKKDTGHLGKVFPAGIKTYFDYFEQALQTIIARLVAGEESPHHILEVWANVEVQSRQQENDKQEFDVLLVTDFGTLVPIDAKTLEFAKKDEDARSLNLQKVSGLYTDFVVCYALFSRDMDPDSIQVTEKEWHKLFSTLKNLRERTTKIFVVCDKDKSEQELLFDGSSGKKGKKKPVVFDSVKNILTKLHLLQENI